MDSYLKTCFFMSIGLFNKAWDEVEEEKDNNGWNNELHCADVVEADDVEEEEDIFEVLEVSDCACVIVVVDLEFNWLVCNESADVVEDGFDFFKLVTVIFEVLEVAEAPEDALVFFISDSWCWFN